MKLTSLTKLKQPWVEHSMVIQKKNTNLSERLCFRICDFLNWFRNENELLRDGRPWAPESRLFGYDVQWEWVVDPQTSSIPGVHGKSFRSRQFRIDDFLMKSLIQMVCRAPRSFEGGLVGIPNSSPAQNAVGDVQSSLGKEPMASSMQPFTNLTSCVSRNSYFQGHWVLHSGHQWQWAVGLPEPLRSRNESLGSYKARIPEPRVPYQNLELQYASGLPAALVSRIKVWAQ